ncbi:hypothetical protein GX50_02390 [[Emmonsia] crescens]|uniref:Uncharacterized protein n=1 Tax=[Emmonsia] crescens TaxID=73230 RepID=A0A2B7ZNR9_9EURO|nr:hypothetical protein GX50_02390 [Emmonsia crescens]
MDEFKIYVSRAERCFTPYIISSPLFIIDATLSSTPPLQTMSPISKNMSDRHSAHFFACILNTISNWCPEDQAKAADVAVGYLISNFHLIHHEQDLDASILCLIKYTNSFHHLCMQLSTSTVLPSTGSTNADITPLALAVKVCLGNLQLVEAFSSIQHEWTALWLSDIESLRRLTHLDRAYTAKSPGPIVRSA